MAPTSKKKRVFNPGPVAVVVDDGQVVPASDHADINPGPLADQAFASGQLLDQSDKPQEGAQ